MSNARVGIILGSASDKDTLAPCEETLAKLGIPTVTGPASPSP